MPGRLSKEDIERMVNETEAEGPLDQPSNKSINRRLLHAAGQMNKLEHLPANGYVKSDSSVRLSVKFVPRVINCDWSMHLDKLF